MMSILVTGASGFIGRAVVKALSQTNELIHAVYHEHKPVESNSIKVHQVDLLDQAAVVRLISDVQPTHLVHLAWCAGHGTYWTDHANLDWLSSSLHLARTFVNKGGQRVLFLGTSAEYDWSGIEPLNEFTTPLNPRLLYGASKLGLYWTMRQFFEQENISWAWARLFNPYGPSESPARLIPKTCIRFLKGETVHFDNAVSLRDFLHVDDVASAIVAAILSPVNGPVNIASGESRSIRNVIESIARHYNLEHKVFFEAAGSRLPIPDSVTADVTRLREECGWSPAKSFEERLKETCEWWKALFYEHQRK